jgi:nucleotide-binding universal stress UspA family protein
MSVLVLIATDGTDESVFAAERALLLVPADARIELVTVIDERHDPEEDAGGMEGPVLTDAEADAEFAQAQESGREAIARTERSLGDRPVTERVVPTGGKVADALADLARQEGADLLVVGPAQARWFDRLLHGDTDAQLIHRAPCPVLVMNHPR